VSSPRLIVAFSPALAQDRCPAPAARKVRVRGSFIAAICHYTVLSDSWYPPPTLPPWFWFLCCWGVDPQRPA